jgi:hypothetical protein
MRIFNVAVPAVALLASSIPAGASSCLLAQYEAIKLVPPQTCWVYEGRATHFTGVFKAGQHITVSMFGLEYAASGGSTAPEDLTVDWSPRAPIINGPGDFTVTSDDGHLEVVLPGPGKYTFWFTPCAMWNAFGRVVICADNGPRAGTKQDRETSLLP